jgi:serine/threonine protein phosphatase PrpC
MRTHPCEPIRENPFKRTHPSEPIHTNLSKGTHPRKLVHANKTHPADQTLAFFIRNIADKGGPKDIHLMMVCDGHGGQLAAKKVAELMPEHIQESYDFDVGLDSKSRRKICAEALFDTFLAVDRVSLKGVRLSGGRRCFRSQLTHVLFTSYPPLAIGSNRNSSKWSAFAT